MAWTIAHTLGGTDERTRADSRAQGGRSDCGRAHGGEDGLRRTPPRLGLAPTPGAGTRLRRWMVLLLVVLASVAVLVSAVALWTHSLLFNTDRWVETVGPVAKDPQVTHDLSVYGDRQGDRSHRPRDARDRRPPAERAVPGPHDHRRRARVRAEAYGGTAEPAGDVRPLAQAQPLRPRASRRGARGRQHVYPAERRPGPAQPGAARRQGDGADRAGAAGRARRQDRRPADRPERDRRGDASRRSPPRLVGRCPRISAPSSSSRATRSPRHSRR